MIKFYKERVVPFKICKECGVEFRAPNKHRAQLGLCYTHWKKWYAEHAEEFRQYYIKNRGKILSKKGWLKWRKAHPDLYNAIQLRTYHRHADKINKKRRAEKFLKPSKYDKLPST